MNIDNLYSLFQQHPHISTDSRRVTPDSIFFALRGDSFDGNCYAIKALVEGAVASVVDDPQILESEEGARFADRLILVDNVLKTLQRLARHHRRELDISILAITGSNGKTTTKELVASVLSKLFRVYATRGNLNNHIGVPLTLLSMDETTEFGVVEMGASSCGEIELLCSIAEPNYGIVTNIGRAHLDGFGGIEGVRRGKGELMDWLSEREGLLFVLSDDETLMNMAEARRNLKFLEYSRGLAEGVAHNLEGEYNRYNVAAAVAIGNYFGVDALAIDSAIGSYHPTNNRSQRSETDHNTLIIDCYNANPSSMDVALANFAGEEFLNCRGKVLILGDMRELGAWSVEEHEAVVRRALNIGAERVILVGEEFRKAAQKMGVAAQMELYASCKELSEALSAHPISNRAILIKGSRGIGLERIVERL